ncbi:MAG: hypothetical protein MJ165_04390 [Alphaproteobacteria bacterium]|nr:hypothetical protein [Alphaproteobacteria bacterium]
MDNVSRLSGILSGLFQSFRRSSYTNYVKKCLTLDTDVIVELAQGTHRWGKCKYALHAVFWALRSADCAEIVETMSPEQIAMVREAMDVAKEYKCPDKEEAEKTNMEYARKNLKSNLSSYTKYINTMIRNAALIESVISENWWEIKHEFERWGTLLNNREQTNEMTNQPEIKQEKQAVPEIKTEEPAPEIQKEKQAVPEIKIKEPAQEIKQEKQAVSEIKIEEPAPEIQKETKTIPEVKTEEQKQEVKQSVVTPETEPNGELWSVETLAENMGLKTNSFYTKKSLFLNANKDAIVQKRFKEFFVKNTKNGVSHVMFRAKYFDELMQMMNPAGAKRKNSKQKDSKQKTVTPEPEVKEELWSTTKLAKQLGLSNKAAFSKKKRMLLERHREYEDEVNSWFVGNKGRFKAEHFDKLRQLIEQNPPAKADIIITEQYGELWTTAKLAHELGLENSISWAWKKSDYLKKHPEARDTFDKWFVKYTDTQRRVMFKASYIENLKALFVNNKTEARAEKRKANKKTAVPQIPNIERKEWEIVGDTIQAAETYVSNTAVAPVAEQPKDLVGVQALRVYLEQLQEMYKKECEIATDAKTEYEDLQTKAEEAKNRAETSQKHADDLKSIITDVTKVVNDWDQASEALKTAEKKLVDQQNRLNKFLKDNTNVLVK